MYFHYLCIWGKSVKKNLGKRPWNYWEEPPVGNCWKEALSGFMCAWDASLLVVCRQTAHTPCTAVCARFLLGATDTLSYQVKMGLVGIPVWWPSLQSCLSVSVCSPGSPSTASWPCPGSVSSVWECFQTWWSKIGTGQLWEGMSAPAVPVSAVLGST